MTPSFWNSSCNNYSKYPNDLHNEDQLGHHQFLSSNSQASSSSNFLTTCLFLNSSVHDQDQILNRESHPPRLHQEGDNFGSQPYNDHRIVNNHEDHNQSEAYMVSDQNQNQLKWMSSKMRVMLKMKKSDPVNILNTSREATNVEEHKLPPSPMEELTDISSNSTSPNNSIPIRVCSDCNTTKTPLWRSGPRGPKSLCNACGIRQRKARRALAAAATESGKNNDLIYQSIIAPLKVTKTQPKDHKKTSIGLVTKYKKRRIYSKQIVAATTTTLPPSRSPSPSPLPSPPSSSPVRKNCVEEFLASLSKNLTFYHVFPQDEKEAAILLMALSCGYAHET